VHLDELSLSARGEAVGDVLLPIPPIFAVLRAHGQATAEPLDNRALPDAHRLVLHERDTQ
jgi:hypothetical protein